MRSKAFAMMSGSAAMALVFLILGCSVDGEWWPLFNVFFILMATLPPMFGATESETIWGAIGDFVEAVLFVSLWGFSVVLYHVGTLSAGAFTLIIMSNLCITATIGLIVYYNGQEYTAIF